MDNDRLELSPLELRPAERERLIASILARATAELERRANADVSPLLLLYQWLRPALAAAAMVAVVCAAVFVWRDAGAPDGGIVDTLAAAQPANEWLLADRAPTVADLVVALEEEDPRW